MEEVSGQPFPQSRNKLHAAGCVAALVHDLTCQLLQMIHLPGSLLSEVRTQLPDFDCTGSIPCCQELSLLDVKFYTVHGAFTCGLLYGKGRLLRALLKVKQMHVSCKTETLIAALGQQTLYLTAD